MEYDYQKIVPYLLTWYDYNARILAWRTTPKPYYVWVSEIMLQQTRVEAVKGYFDRFITALPDIQALADIEEEKLLKLWEGLGYYNRVRNLQKAAKVVVSDYKGELPADYYELLKLPGIGAYTAGAIASIAFQLPVPAVDGNVLRVTKRIAGSFDDITKDKVKEKLWKDLSLIIPKDRPGDFNQALMDLGATICLPNGKPLCDSCPVMHLCRAFRENLTDRIPVKPEKNKRKIEEKTILLIEYQGSYALHRREAKGLLAGLWEFPGLAGKLNRDQVNQELKQWDIEPVTLESIGEAKHIFTHIEWHMIGYLVRLKDYPHRLTEGKKLIWVDPSLMKERYTLPNAFSAFRKYWIQEKQD